MKEAHTLELLLLLAVIIVASKTAGALSNRIGQPAVFGELLIGLILGPTVLNVLGWPVFHGAELGVFVKALGEIGVIFLMFLAGMETELDQMRRVGRAATSAALGGVVLPFGAGAALGMLFGFGLYESLFIGTILTATSVSISAQTLLELGQLRSKEGTAILGAAVIDDVVGIIILSFVVAFGGANATGDLGSVAFLVVRIIAYFIIAILAGRFLFERILGWVDRRLRASEVLLAFSVVLILLYSWSAEALGHVAAITGAYIAGILFAQTRFKHQLEDKIKVISYGFFVPIFFVSIGLQANARELGGTVLFTTLIILAAILTKIGGAMFGGILGHLTLKESIRVGTGMVSRGEVALIVANIGLGAGVIGRDIFTVMVLMTLVTTLVTPIMLRALFERAPEPEGERGQA